MTRVIKCCWCRSTSPSWRTTTTMSSTTQHTHSDRCWYHHQGSGVVTSIYTLQLSQYEYEATLTIKNVSSVENGFEHFLYMTTRWNLKILQHTIITFIPILVSTQTLQSLFSTTSCSEFFPTVGLACDCTSTQLDSNSLATELHLQRATSLFKPFP